MPKKLEGYHSGHGRQYNPHHDHLLWLWYSMIEEGPNKAGLYLFYTTYLFCTIFLINFVLPSGNLLHMPPNFLFL